jgi:predicted PurR-regulated permease PerM
LTDTTLQDPGAKSGPTGATGKPGATGAAGKAGAVGAAGMDGAVGAAGKAGAVGAKGATGVDGAVGAAGIDGAVGAAGVDGAVGAAGVDGTAGVDGVAGAAGVRGAAGDSRINLASGGLALLALTAALYLARSFFVPLLIGMLASYALHPLVNRLESWRVPRSIGAALVLAMVVGTLSWIAVSVSGDAEALIGKWPEAARQLRAHLSVGRSSAPSALQNMRETAEQLQGAASDGGAQAVQVKLETPEPTWLTDYALAQTALIVNVAAQTPIVLLLTYFLLASGVHFRRKLIGLVGPTLTRKKEAVRILEQIDVQVQRYLFAMLASNTLLALLTWLAFLALGVDQAGMWGVAAGVLHFVPYLGPALVAVGVGLAAFVQFGSLFWGLAVAITSLVIAAIVGFVFMTWLHSRFARVNTAVLFIALLFFGWLWGVWGLLLGAPLVAIAKVVFDRVESLKPAGELLGH